MKSDADLHANETYPLAKRWLAGMNVGSALWICARAILNPHAVRERSVAWSIAKRPVSTRGCAEDIKGLLGAWPQGASSPPRPIRSGATAQRAVAAACGMQRGSELMRGHPRAHALRPMADRGARSGYELQRPTEDARLGQLARPRCPRCSKPAGASQRKQSPCRAGQSREGPRAISAVGPRWLGYFTTPERQSAQRSRWGGSRLPAALWSVHSIASRLDELADAVIDVSPPRAP